MRASDDLHQLIQTLGKEEKRYFKLFANLGAGRANVHSIALFDRISSMESYDEPRLKKKIKDKALAKNLATGKNRLYELIMKSQRLLRSGGSIDSQLAVYLENLEFLFEKRQIKPARKSIRKAKALAERFEKEAMLLKFLDWEQRFFVLEPNEEEPAFYSRNESEENRCMERLALQRKLVRLYEQIRSLSRQGLSLQDVDRVRQFEIIGTDEAITGPAPGNSFLCAALYHAIRGIYGLARRNFEGAWSDLHELMNLWKSNPHRIEDLADFYLGSVNNYLNACLVSGTHTKDFLAQVSSIRSLEGLPAATKLKFDRVAWFHESVVRINFGSFTEGVRFIQDLSLWLQRNENQLQDGYLLEFYFNITLFFFVYSEFSASQKWLRKILNFPATEARADIRDFARVFQLVLQYELGNLDVQEYLLRSAYRYFQRTQKLHDFEDALLEFMKMEQKIGLTEPAQTREGFEKLHQRWSAIQAIKEGPQPQGLQALLFWVESRLAGTTLRDYYAEKVKGQLKED